MSEYDVIRWFLWLLYRERWELPVDATKMEEIYEQIWREYRMDL